MKNCKWINSLAAVLLLGTTGPVAADEQSTAYKIVAASDAGVATPVASNADELAKQLSNPISSLISVPFQYNYSRTYGDNGYRNLLNIQPVIPISISEDWNLISRTIVPVIQQKNVQPDRAQFGLGDTTQSFWLSPKEPTSSGWIWGAGAAAVIPTGYDGLGASTWALGPTIVVLKQTGSWTYGVLWNQVWNVSGPADISSMFVQPFLVKGLGKGRTLALNSESTYNWKTKDWNVPINLAYSKISKWGDQMVSNQIGAGWYAESPAGGADWQLRYTLTLLFPR
jgi:hypothetical protein